MTGALQALGGLGLFLLGMKILEDGLESLAGRTVRRALARFTRSPTTGAATGAVMTALVQSSSVTTVAAVGFVGAGLLTFPQALGVIFGANAGTTITGWIVALVGFKLDLGSALVPLILPAILVHLGIRGRAGAVALAVCGFALVFQGLDLLKLGLSGLESVITPEVLPGDDLLGRLALVGIGAIITLITQSSSAGVAAAIAAVHGGSIELTQAAAMVIGMDVGTTFTAGLAAVGAPAAARRTGYAHIIYNCMTAVGAFAALPLYFYVLGPDVSEPELALVGFHTLFNGLGVLAVLPLTRRFAALMIRLVPEPEQRWLEHLTPGLLLRPAAALDAVHGALRSIVASVMAVTADGLDGRRTWSEVSVSLREATSAVERVGQYLDEIRVPTLDPSDRIRHRRVLHTIDHLLRIGNRCQRRDPGAAALSDPELEQARAQVAASLRRVADGPPDEAMERDLAVLRVELSDRDESYRRRVVEHSADMGTEEAMDRMDEFRFARRLTHHGWRIVHHLRAAGEPPPVRALETEMDWDE